jgi:hypothetical protein
MAHHRESSSTHVSVQKQDANMGHPKFNVGHQPKATLKGIAEAVTGAPDEIKAGLQVLSTNRAALAATASIEVGTYYALGTAAATTVGAAVSEVLIPGAIAVYVVWRAYEGYKAADEYMEQNASQCSQL